MLSDRTLTNKAYLNAIASLLEYATSLLVGFLLTPFVVAGLGDYSFGLWQLLNRLVGYLTPASGRPTYALKWTLANQQASADFAWKRRQVGSTLVLWLVFLPALLGLGGLVAWFLPGWIKAPPGYVWIVRIAALLLILNMVVDTLANVPQAVLQGENLGYKRMGMTAGLVIVGGVFTWGAVQLRLGLVGLGLSVVAATALTGLFFLTIVRSYTPWFGTARPFAEDLKQMLGRTWGFLGWNLVTSLLLASDVVVLGLFNSVASVTNYTLTKYVPEMMISIIASVVFAIMPGLGGIVGSGDLSRASRLRGELLSLVWLVVTGLGTAILLWNRSFMELWVGPERYSGSLPNLLIVVGVMQLVFIRSDASIIDVTLHLSQKVLLGLLSVTISVVAASLLVGYCRMGIVGLCLGIMSGRFILSIGYPFLVSHFLHISRPQRATGLARQGLVTAILFGLAFAADIFVPTRGWPGSQHWIGFFVSAGISGLSLMIFAFFAGLTEDQRRNILRRARMVYSHTGSGAAS